MPSLTALVIAIVQNESGERMFSSEGRGTWGAAGTPLTPNAVTRGGWGRGEGEAEGEVDVYGGGIARLGDEEVR